MLNSFHKIDFLLKVILVLTFCTIALLVEGEKSVIVIDSSK